MLDLLTVHKEDEAAEAEAEMGALRLSTLVALADCGQRVVQALLGALAIVEPEGRRALEASRVNEVALEPPYRSQRPRPVCQFSRGLGLGEPQGALGEMQA